MPIGGVVITCRPEDRDAVLKSFEPFSEIEVHGADESGNIVAVLDTESSEEMEKLIDRINKNNDVLNVGLTYLNTEDEAEQLAEGKSLGKPFGFKKTLPREQ